MVSIVEEPRSPRNKRLSCRMETKPENGAMNMEDMKDGRALNPDQHDRTTSPSPWKSAVSPFVIVSQLDTVKLLTTSQPTRPMEDIPEEALQNMFPQEAMVTLARSAAMLAAEVSWLELATKIQLPKELTEEMTWSRRRQGEPRRDAVKFQNPEKMELREYAEEARRS